MALELKTLDVADAEKAIAAGVAMARRYGRPMAFVVADREGEPIATLRMDGAAARNMRQALRKAKTSAIMARNTLAFKRDLEERGGSLPEWGDQQLTTLQGGYVVKPVEIVEKQAMRISVDPLDDIVLGSVACGGLPLELDEEVARTMVRAMGYKPVVDERVVVHWKAKTLLDSGARRTTMNFPVGGDWIKIGQEPISASRVGNLVITSGIPGINRKTGVLPETPAEQFQLAYENLRFVLESMGVAERDEIAHLTVFIPDPSFRNLINRGWMALYPDGERPARKTNQVPLPEGMFVQLQAIAVVGEKRVALEIPGLAHRDPLPMGVKAGPYVFSSVISPQDPKTGETVKGGALAQIKQGFENVKLLMEQAGGTVDDANHLWVFMKNFDHQPAMVDEWVAVYPKEGDRPARKTVQYELGANTEIQIQTTGYVKLGVKRVNFETPGHTHHDPIPMAARTGGLMQSSGISGIDPATGKVPGDLDAQIKWGMYHVRNLMKESGGTLDDIVSITILLRHLEQAAVIDERLVELFPDPAKRPAIKYINYRMPGSSHLQYHVTALIGE